MLPAASSTPHSPVPRRIDLEVFTDAWAGDRFHVLMNAASGPVSWTCGAQKSTATLAEALDQAGFDPTKKVLAIIDASACPKEPARVAEQIANAGFAAIALRMPGNRHVNEKRDLERALFMAGLRKHGAYYSVRGYEALNEPDQDFAGVYIPIDPAATQKYPISFLQERRELHMDMLREEGTRSDAHVIRYTFGAEQIPRGARRILDACCGYGYGSLVLSHFHPSARVCGIDIDDVAIAYANQIYAAPNRSFVCSDMLEHLRGLPDGSIDAICFFEGMEHLENINEVLTEMNRVLSLEGKLITSVPNHWVDETGDDPNPHHVMVYDWENIRSTLTQVLNLESCYSQIGSRLNHDGVWKPAPRAFREVPVHATDPGAAEWWLCVGRKRIVPTVQMDVLQPETSFALEELILRVQGEETKVVSFDVFDTLLVRPTLLPADVFLMLQAELVGEFGPLFAGFARLRHEAEAEVRRLSMAAGLGDILLTEIYARLADYLHLTPDEASALMERELALEERLLKPRLSGKRVYEAALAAGKQVIIASDIYLTHEQLCRLLSAHGYDRADRVYVSGELRQQKRTGVLFDRILDDLRRQGIKPADILHIGDNPVADVRSPSERGIPTELFTKGHDAYSGGSGIWPQGPDMRAAEDLDVGLRSTLGCTTTTAFDNPYRRLEPDTMFDRSPYLYGAVHLAPFLFFAMKDLLDQCTDRGLSRVFFVTRDGHLPKAVFTRLAQAMGVEIEARDLHLSRALLQALQAEDLPSALRIMANRLSRGSTFVFGDYLSELLGAPADDVLGQSDWTVKSFAQTEVSLANLDSARHHLAALWPVLEPTVIERRRRVLAYVGGCFEGVDPAKCAVWDVGYFHSIALALQGAGVQIGLSTHLVEIGHHAKRYAESLPVTRAHSYLGTVNNRLDQNIYDTGLHSVFLEVLLSDPTSASRNLFNRDGLPVVLAEDATLRGHNVKPLELIHNGVMTGIEAIIQGYPVAHLRRLRCSPAQAFSLALSREVLRELVSQSSMVFDNNGLSEVAKFLE